MDDNAAHISGRSIHNAPGHLELDRAPDAPTIDRHKDCLGGMSEFSDDRVYLAAGAIVEGRFNLAKGSENITVRGRGILSCGEWPHATTRTAWLTEHATFYSYGTHHFTLEGLTLVQGSGWTVAIDDSTGHDTHDNLYRNVKMVHWAGNTDAFWMTGDRNVCEDSFVFNNDDAIVSKGGSDCRVSDLVVWGGAWGRLMLLFNFGRPIERITVESVDLIGKGESRQLILSERIRRSGPIDVRDLTFRNVRIEDRSPQTTSRPSVFLDLDAAASLERFDGFHFENVTLDQQFADEGRIDGTPALPATNVTFENLRMGDRPIRSAAEGRMRFNESVLNVRFAPTTQP